MQSGSSGENMWGRECAREVVRETARKASSGGNYRIGEMEI